GQVHRQYLVPFLVLHAHEEVVAGHAGIVDKDVEPAQRTLGGRHELVDLVLVAEIARQDRVLAAAHFPGCILERGNAGARQRDARPGLAQRPGDLAPDPPRGARHQRAFSRQIKHLKSPWEKMSQAPRAASAASMSVGVPIAVAVASGAIRLARPVSTLLAPSS